MAVGLHAIGRGGKVQFYDNESVFYGHAAP